jgi:hypothetical protein
MRRRRAAIVFLTSVATTMCARSAPAADLRVGLAPAGQSARRVVRAEQVHRGLPVLGRGIVMSGALRVEDLATDLPADVTPRVPAAEAAARAQAWTRVPLSSSDAALVVHARGDRTELAYLFRPDSGGLPTAPRIVVSAVTGEVLEARDAARFVRAFTFETNPARSAHPSMLPILLPPAGERLETRELVARSCRDDGEARVVSLDGTRRDVRVCAIVPLARAKAGDFVYPPLDVPESTEATRKADDPFAEVSLYYHAARAHAFFRELGGGEAPPLGSSPLALLAGVRVARGLLEGDFETASRKDVPLDPFPFALHLPGSAGEGDAFRALYGVTGGALLFGQGYARDFAYDGDVVYHELTHALISATLHVGGLRITEHGASAEPEAIDEALADYFSSALAGDPLVGEYASGEVPDGSALRSLDNQASCPGSITGQPHADGLVMSGALWSVRSALDPGSRRSFDAAIYQALRLSPGRADLSFADLAALLLASLSDTVASAAPLLRDELARRGVLPECVPVRIAGAAQSVAGEGGPFFAPGTNAFPGSEIAPGVVQLDLELPAGARRAVVRFAGADAPRSALFGRPGTPFRPVVLAQWDRPLVWRSEGGRVTSDAAVVVDADRDAQSFTATIDVPPGVRVVRLQIGNRGAEDGAYDHVAVRFDEGPADPPTPIEARGSGCVASAAPGYATRGAGMAWLVLAVASAARVRRGRRRS